MMDERKFRIATGRSRFDRRWVNTAVSWEYLRERFSEPVETHETASEYRAFGRDMQTRIKDVGGFVGGYLRNGVRKVDGMEARSLATFDYDAFSPERVKDIERALAGWRWIMHSTHKHTDTAWRVRLIVPLGRDVTPDEYGAVARKIAQKCGFDGIDRSTFEPCRLMFWPSKSKGAPYFFTTNGTFTGYADPDAILAEYDDWTDTSTWPRLPEEELAGLFDSHEPDRPVPMAATEALRGAGRNGKQEDPLEKKGLVGAFCRTYDIHSAIASFLPDVYIRTGNNRYTHIGSKTSNGAWVLDSGRFLYSFHGTDPVAGILVNSWDLVRLHKFRELDIGKDRQDRLPSVREMEKLALEDAGVRRRLMDERAAAAGADFDGMDLGSQDEEDIRTWDELRGEKLKTDKNGEVKTNAENLEFILKNHPLLKGRLRFNEFSGRIDVSGTLPWRRWQPTWTANDSVKLRSFLDRRFGMTGEKKIEDAVTSVSIDSSYHPVRVYLDSLTWDGERRLHRVFRDVLGAEDLPVYGKLSELIFTAAVRRIREPGCKFDYFVVLQGPEGCGKSSLFSVMGGEWFSDSVDTIEGKEGRENIQGKWIIEMAELSATKKSDRDRLKNFISSQVDDYRAAYAAKSESRPRQCILVGTTNEEYFLRGMMDRNRRQPVVEIDPEKRTVSESVREWLTANRDQLWAEACALEALKEPLYLSDEWEAQIRDVQDRHNLEKSNILFPEVLEFLDYYLPEGWERRSLEERRAWIRAQNEPGSPSLIERREKRQTVCIAEILQEFLGMEKTDREYNVRNREMGQFLSSLKGKWGCPKLCRNRLYGVQKTWKRVVNGSVNEGVNEASNPSFTPVKNVNEDSFTFTSRLQFDEDLNLL